MKRTKIRFLSVFLTVCMIVSCMVGLSVTAGATSDPLLDGCNYSASYKTDGTIDNITCNFKYLDGDGNIGAGTGRQFNWLFTTDSSKKNTKVGECYNYISSHDNVWSTIASQIGISSPIWSGSTNNATYTNKQRSAYPDIYGNNATGTCTLVQGSAVINNSATFSQFENGTTYYGLLCHLYPINGGSQGYGGFYTGISIEVVYHATRNCSVTITGGANATRSGGDATQTGLTGAMTDVTYTAENGYYFESFTATTTNGITMTRTNDTVVTISGTPSSNTEITVPDAVVIPHTHDFTYSASGATITATCGGDGDCDISEGLTLTISAPASLGYDGTEKAATLSTGYNTTAFAYVSDISYTKGGEAYDGTPTDAGTYTASVSAGASAENCATASVEFTITAGEAEITTPPTASAITYGQTLANSTLSGGAASVDGTFGWKTPATKPAVSDSNTTEYDVVFTPDNTNYSPVETKIKLTVNKGEPKAPTGLTATEGQTLADVALPAGWTWADSTTSVGEPGENTFKADYTDTAGNYNNASDVDLTVTVIAKGTSGRVYDITPVTTTDTSTTPTTPAETKPEEPKTEEPKAGLFADTTDEEKNEGGASIAESEADLADAVLTDSDLEALANGENINVYLEMTEIKPTVTEKKALEDLTATVSPEALIGMFFDASLFKQIGAAAAQKVTSTKQPIKAAFVVPDEFINTDPTVIRSFFIGKIHDGATTAIPCDFDPLTNIASFENDSWSTFCLIYFDKPAEAETPTQEEPTAQVDPATETNPHTGVSLGGLAVMMISGLAVAASRKRKNK